MITIEEYNQISEAFQLFEGEAPEFTEEQLEKAEYYSLNFDNTTFTTELTLFDGLSQKLASVTFEDADLAIAFVEELFDLDDEDMAELEDYSWITSEIGTDLEEG